MNTNRQHRKENNRKEDRLRATAAALPTNPVRNAYLPAENEVWAQLRPTPEDFIHDSFVSTDIEPGIREITGKLKATGETCTAAYCFAAGAPGTPGRFDAAAAQAWLSKKGIQPAKLDPAKDQTYRQITARGVSLTGSAFRLQAAEAGLLPRLDILVYSGGPVQPEGWDLPIIVDLAGLDIPAGQTPVLFNHDPDQVVGHGTASNSGRALRLQGVVSAIGPAAKEVVTASKNGFEWKSSIGCDRIGEPQIIKTGETIQCNGRSFAGPCYYWPHSVLQEVTITGRGADPHSQVSIAAKARRLAAKASTPLRSPNMDEQFESWVKALGLDPAKLEDTQKATLGEAYAALHAEAAKTESDEGGKEEVEKKMAARMRKTFAAETQRLDTITRAHNQLCAAWALDVKEHREKRQRGDALRAQAAAENWSTEKVELEFLRLGRPEGVVSNTRANGELNGKVLEAAACRSSMMSDANLEKYFDAPTLEASRHPDLRSMGLKSLMVRAAADRGWTGRWIESDNDIEDVLHAIYDNRQLRAEASTFSLPGIMSNLANKFLYQGFWAVESAWQEIAASRPVNDFKPHYSFRFYGDLTYEKVGATGEIKHGSVGEIQYVNAAQTYAKMFTTTRQDIRNDDLGALSQLPQAMGMGAAYALNEVFWALWLAGVQVTAGITGGAGGKTAPTVTPGTATHWSVAHANLLSGATSPLSSSALTLAEQKFNEQKKPDGKPLAIGAEILLVPPALKNVADRLFTSEKLFEAVTGLASTASKSTELVPSDNPHKGLFRVVMSRYLAEAFSLTGASNTAWWLLANPAMLPTAEIAFLDGQQTPTVQSSEADFNTLGIQHRGFFDFGCALTDYRGSLMSAGA